MDMLEWNRMQLLLLETIEAQKQQLAQTGRMLELQRQDSARLARQLVQATGELQQMTRRLEGGAEKFSRDALDALRSQTRDAVGGSIGQAAEASRRQLETTAQVAARSAQEVSEATEALRRQRGLWSWTAPLALIVGAALAAGGSSYIVWKNMDELKRAQFGQDILQATQSGALTRCGESLCVRVGKKPERFAQNAEYVLLGD